MFSSCYRWWRLRKAKQINRHPVSKGSQSLNLDLSKSRIWAFTCLCYVRFGEVAFFCANILPTFMERWKLSIEDICIVNWTWKHTFTSSLRLWNSIWSLWWCLTDRVQGPSCLWESSLNRLWCWLRLPLSTLSPSLSFLSTRLHAIWQSWSRSLCDKCAPSLTEGSRA